LTASTGEQSEVAVRGRENHERGSGRQSRENRRSVAELEHCGAQRAAGSGTAELLGVAPRGDREGRDRFGVGSRRELIVNHEAVFADDRSAADRVTNRPAAQHFAETAHGASDCVGVGTAES
jgi:hypothetical protein